MAFFFVQLHFFSLYFHYEVKISILMKCLERIGFFENEFTQTTEMHFMKQISAQNELFIFIDSSGCIGAVVDTLYKVSYKQYCCT